MVTSEATHSEFCQVFLRPKFDKYIALNGRQLLLDTISKNLVFTKIKKPVNACRDPKDNKFLELALAAKASCIITGDGDLLVLNPFRKIPILNASNFLIQF